MPRIKWSFCVKSLVFVSLLSWYFVLRPKTEQISAEIKFFLNRFSSSVPVPNPSWSNVLQLTREPRFWEVFSGTEVIPVQGCSLPKLDPWHPDILQYVSSVPQISCRGNQESLLYTSRNFLYKNQTAVKNLGLKSEDVSCTYSYLRYIDTDTYKIMSDLVLNGERAKLLPEHTAVLTSCHLSKWNWIYLLLPKKLFRLFGFEIYRNMLSYVPEIKDTKVRDNQDEFSVFTLIFDSVSQMNSFRSLPRTLRVMEDAGGVVFKGHHKVGHNTYPNVMALLSGENGGVWPPDIPERQGMYYFDVERQPLISKLFQKYGYLTFNLEDMQLYGSLTRVGRVGFKNNPFQINYRAMYWAIDQSYPDLRNNLVGKFGAYACQQEKMAHTYQFRTIEDFLSMYKNHLYHAHVHLSEYVHNDVNMAKHYDKDLSGMLERLIVAGSLNKTFVFLLSDHGYQRAEGHFVQTEQGGIENNMPFLIVLPPSEFQDERKLKNLRQNSDKLTSHFDINQTLRDILRMASPAADEDLRKLEGHGVSFFNTLHYNRTCKQADIPADYCSCVDGITKIPSDHESVADVVSAILIDREESLLPLGVCQPLKIRGVKDAWLKVDQDLKMLKLQFQIEAKFAEFEAVLKEENGEVSVRLTRQDLYSETGSCIPQDKEYLRPYCICR